MSLNPLIAAGRKVWRTLCVTLGCLLAMPVLAMGLTVLQADDSAAHTEFVRQLRETQDPGGRFALVRVGPGAQARATTATAVVMDTGADDERGNVGVRTRGPRTDGVADSITVAVGLDAAKVALEQPGNEPLVLAMLSRLDYEGLKGNAAMRRPDRRIGVLLRDPAMADQITLVDVVLPRKRRLGMIATNEAEPVLREVQRAAQGWDLQIEYAPDAGSLAAALKTLLPRSDALLVLPDLIGDDQAATLAVLRAAATAGVPVFGASDGLVRSGGLAAAVSTPTLLARQARVLGQKVAAGGGSGIPLVEPATPSTVRVNATVARALGLRLPDERELTERITAVR